MRVRPARSLSIAARQRASPGRGPKSLAMDMNEPRFKCD